jgi:hypothetical protein
MRARRRDKKCHRAGHHKRRRGRGLTRKQHAFIREKVLGMNAKDAALAAGYSFPVAENTWQKIWKTRVRAEFELLNEFLMR